MIDSSVLLPEPEAPTMAAVSLGARVKSISRKMSSVPVESVTDLWTCSTEMMGSDMFAGGWSRRHFIAAALAGCYALPAAAAGGQDDPGGWRLPQRRVWPEARHRLGGRCWKSGWPAENLGATVVNASISGDTTSGGRSRLPALLAQHKPDIVVIELGGNDALRGLPLAMTEDNLSHMTQAAQKAGAKVLLVGMQVPPNYGADYAEPLRRPVREGRQGAQGGARALPAQGRGRRRRTRRGCSRPTASTPREEAQPLILDNVWPELKKLLAANGALGSADP